MKVLFRLMLLAVSCVMLSLAFVGSSFAASGPCGAGYHQVGYTPSGAVNCVKDGSDSAEMTVTPTDATPSTFGGSSVLAHDAADPVDTETQEADDAATGDDCADEAAASEAANQALAKAELGMKMKLLEFSLAKYPGYRAEGILELKDRIDRVIKTAEGNSPYDKNIAISGSIEGGRTVSSQIMYWAFDKTEATGMFPNKAEDDRIAGIKAAFKAQLEKTAAELEAANDAAILAEAALQDCMRKSINTSLNP